MEKIDWSRIQKIIVPILKLGGVGVVPTDTLYGIVGSALDKKTVERIYAIRKRDLEKPMIILISGLSDLKKFGIALNAPRKKMLNGFWPGKVSVIFDCKSKKFEYLHRGKNTLAFRLPDDLEIIKLLKKTGPLVAPSANREGEKPATNYPEAKKYFGEEIDFYVDGGKLRSKPSVIISMNKKGEINVLREGAVKIAKMPIMA